jgi:hypothetical protein
MVVVHDCGAWSFDLVVAVVIQTLKLAAITVSN